MVGIDLGGQVAVLTGGSRGIGAATVQLLAQAGARVVFSYRRDRAAAEAVVADAGGSDRVLAARADAAKIDSAERLVQFAARRFGRVDIAIANAGAWNAKDIAIEDLDAGTWRRMLAANLDGAYALARAAVRQMKRQSPEGAGGAVRRQAGHSHSVGSARKSTESAGGVVRRRGGRARGAAPCGRIVLVASTAGQRGEAWHTHYGAAKGGVIAFTRGLAPEVARDGILVNCVAPGWVDTDMSRPAFGTYPERVFAAIPLGRPGRPEEIAGSILFLCTPWANFMTGSVLSVNGGAVLS